MSHPHMPPRIRFSLVLNRNGSENTTVWKVELRVVNLRTWSHPYWLITLLYYSSHGPSPIALICDNTFVFVLNSFFIPHSSYPAVRLHHQPLLTFQTVYTQTCVFSSPPCPPTVPLILSLPLSSPPLPRGLHKYHFILRSRWHAAKGLR